MLRSVLRHIAGPAAQRTEGPPPEVAPVPASDGVGADQPLTQTQVETFMEDGYVSRPPHRFAYSVSAAGSRPAAEDVASLTTNDGCPGGAARHPQ